MFNEKFWLAISFTAFVIFIIKYVRPTIARALDNKSKAIAEEILAAKELKEKAVKLLEKAKKHQKEAEEYAQNLVKNAEIEAQNFANESQKILETEIAKKTIAAIERIKIEETAAIREIKSKIVSLAIENISKNISSELTENHHDQLNTKAVEDFKKVVH